MSEERQWIEACQQGHRSAYEPMVRRYGPIGYRFALSVVRNPEDAKDLSQEALIRAYYALHRFDLERPFYPWFLKILRNLCLSHLRRSRPTVTLEDIPPLAQPSHVAPELRLAVGQALEAMDEKHREILVLKEFQDLTYTEISAVLGIPRGTVMSRLYHARRRLRELLNVNVKGES